MWPPRDLTLDISVRGQTRIVEGAGGAHIVMRGVSIQSPFRVVVSSIKVPVDVDGSKLHYLAVCIACRLNFAAGTSWGAHVGASDDRDVIVHSPLLALPLVSLLPLAFCRGCEIVLKIGLKVKDTASEGRVNLQRKQRPDMFSSRIEIRIGGDQGPHEYSSLATCPDWIPRTQRATSHDEGCLTTAFADTASRLQGQHGVGVPVAVHGSLNTSAACARPGLSGRDQRSTLS